MITSNNEKLEAIVKHFNIGSFEKGIEKMHNIMAHVLQEKCDSDEVQIIKYNTIVDEVYQRLQSENYKKPNVACKHFAYLGQKIGEYFGKEVGIIHCHPKHIANGNHYMLDDGEKYYDPSAYNAIFFSGKWMNVKETGIKLTDIPKEFIDKEANFILFKN